MPSSSSLKGRLAFLLPVILVFSTSFISGQQSEPEGEPSDTAQKRAEWFARERGVEPGRLPSGLRAQALRHLERMRADEKRRGAAALASGTMSVEAAVNPASSTPWKPIGPSPLVDSNGTKYSGRISA